MIMCVYIYIYITYNAHLPSLARVRDVHPPWSWKPKRPMEVGSPKVISQVEGTIVPLVQYS